jgi:hypothetical protein
MEKGGVLEWARERLGPVESELVVSTGFSEVWRLRREGAVYYAKAVRGDMRSEPGMFGLIEKIAGAGACPQVVAADALRGYFVARELAGPTLRETFARSGFDADLACGALAAMVALQKKMSQRAAECLGAGSLDWRGERLAKEYEAMLDAPGFAKAHGLGAGEIERARGGSEVFERSRKALGKIIPGDWWSDNDLNEKNMIAGKLGFGFVDMGETSMGPPLVGLCGTVGSFRGKNALKEGSPEDLAMRSACLDALGVALEDREKAWGAAESARAVYGAVCLNRLVGSSGPELLEDPRYASRMREALAGVAEGLEALRAEDGLRVVGEGLRAARQSEDSKVASVATPIPAQSK